MIIPVVVTEVTNMLHFCDETTLCKFYIKCTHSVNFYIYENIQFTRLCDLRVVCIVSDDFPSLHRFVPQIYILS